MKNLNQQSEWDNEPCSLEHIERKFKSFVHYAEIKRLRISINVQYKQFFKRAHTGRLKSPERDNFIERWKPFKQRYDELKKRQKNANY